MSEKPQATLGINTFLFLSLHFDTFVFAQWNATPVTSPFFCLDVSPKISWISCLTILWPGNWISSTGGRDVLVAGKTCEVFFLSLSFPRRPSGMPKKLFFFGTVKKIFPQEWKSHVAKLFFFCGKYRCFFPEGSRVITAFEKEKEVVQRHVLFFPLTYSLGAKRE